MAAPAIFALLSHADKIPDKVFHNIPGGYFCPPEEKEKKQHKEGRRSSRHDSASGSRSRSSGGSNGSRGRNADERPDENKRRDNREQRRPRNNRSRGSGSLGRGYESDEGPKSPYQRKKESAYYFDPPPTEAIAEAEEGQALIKPTKPYSPSDYDAEPGTRDDYYVNHPDERAPYHPGLLQPEPPGKEGRPHVDTDRNYRANRSLNDDGLHRDDRRSRAYDYAESSRDYRRGSTSEQRYTPAAAYNASRRPSQPVYGSTAPPPNYGSYSSPPPVYPVSPLPTAMAPYNGPPEDYSAYPQAQPIPYVQYDPSKQGSPQVNDESRPRGKSRGMSRDKRRSKSRGRSDDRSPSRSSQRDRSGSRSRSASRRRSRSRSRAQSKKGSQRNRSTSRLRHQMGTFSRDRKDIAGAALGALAGGLLAHRAGKGNSMTTVVGAALGGLGGMIGERKWEEEKAHKRRSRGEDIREGRMKYERSPSGYYSS